MSFGISFYTSRLKVLSFSTIIIALSFDLKFEVSCNFIFIQPLFFFACVYNCVLVRIL